MNKLFGGLMMLMALSSCAGMKYNVSGTASVEDFDGKKLYLKAVDEQDELKAIDSCEVVHGAFSFRGHVDSSQVVMLYMDEEGLMPVVLEEGNIVIVINNQEQTVKNTGLNEKLYKYIDVRRQIENKVAEIPHTYSQMIMDGIDEDVIRMQLSGVQQMLSQSLDSLDTHFVKENFENILGPAVFMNIVSNLRYPVLTPQIEDILSSAPQSFKDSRGVRRFLDEANENMKQLQYIPGTATDEAVAAKKDLQEK